MRRRWLGTLLLAPLLMGGCAAKSATTTEEPAKGGDAWVLVDQGKALKTAAPKSAGKPSPLASGFLPLPSAAATPTPNPSGSSCPPEARNGLNFASVQPASTSAAVTFYHRGGDNLVEYRVTAIAEDLSPGEQRDVGWTVVTPAAGCGFMTATVTGLDPKSDYVFSVDAVTTQHERDGTRAATVARSRVVRTL